MQTLRDIETARLILRRLAQEHASALHDVFSNPEAMRFWHQPRHERPEQTQSMVAGMTAGPEDAWVLIPRGARDAVGLVYYLGDSGSGSRGLGYILHPAHWRQGLMSEAVRATLDYGFDNSNLDRVELWIDALNVKSQAVARRMGFTPRGHFRHKYPHCAMSHETIVFGLQIDEWRPGAAPRQRAPIDAYGLVPILDVADVRATAEWYRDRLGFQIAFLIGEPPTYGIVALGNWPIVGAQIHLVKTARAAPPAGITLQLNVGPGIDALFELHQSKGVMVVEPPTTKPWNAREFAITDCNGAILRFSTPV